MLYEKNYQKVVHFYYTFTREMKVLKYKIIFCAMGIETLLLGKNRVILTIHFFRLSTLYLYYFSP